MVNKFIFSLIKEEKFFKYYVALLLVTSLMIIASPLLLGNVVKIVTKKQGMSEFFIAISMYIFVVLFQLSIRYFKNRQSGKMYNRMSLNATQKLYNIAVKKNVNFLMENNSSNISHKINNTYENIRTYLMAIFDSIIISIVLYVSYLGIMFYIYPILGVCLVLLSVIFNYFLYLRREKLKNKRREYSKSKDNLLSYITDTISNIILIKSFNKKHTNNEKYNILNKDAEIKAIDSINYGSTQAIIGQAIVPLFRISTIAFGSYGLMTDTIEIYQFVMIFSIATPLAFYIENILSGFNTYTQTQGILENTLELINEENLEDETKKDLTFKNGTIELKDINFKYASGDIVLKDFNLNIASKQKIALIGKSGAGKSTIISLIQGFYEVTDGKVLFDNQDVKDVNLNSLRQVISYIPQEPSLLSRSIFENIAFAKDNATQEEVINAAKLANAHEFIEKLPNGYDELVGERGFKLSGGQKQRIAIARAILKDSPIIIMDEATSALDSHSEKLIQQSLEHLIKDKTCIVIAHRLSTIRSMDRIIVLDNGNIVQDGNHNSLVRKNGLYKDLWSLQQEGFIE
jgi:ABC-type multidrug transport system fused ATPase/permease subunit